jgi:hypothetical protein
MVRLAERLEELAAEELEHDGTTGLGHVEMRR